MIWTLLQGYLAVPFLNSTSRRIKLSDKLTLLPPMRLKHLRFFENLKQYQLLDPHPLSEIRADLINPSTIDHAVFGTSSYLKMEKIFDMKVNFELRQRSALE